MNIKMKRLFRRLSSREDGFLLIEALIALALIGILAVTFSSGFGTGSKALTMTDERETAKNLAESQMEYVYDLPFASSYSPAPIGSEYPNYSADITTTNITSRDGSIQKITVIIKHHGEEVLRLEGDKTR
jgi:type II secretory pathway pseudopilin PulG